MRRLAKTKSSAYLLFKCVWVKAAINFSSWAATSFSVGWCPFMSLDGKQVAKSLYMGWLKEELKGIK
jgi:hypothetical protein